MRYLCAILGYLTGKSQVRCTDCAHLDSDGKCYGHPMPADIIHQTISCGFWKHK